MHVPHTEGAPEHEGVAAPRSGQESRGDRISVGAGDDQVTRIQLAARWAELFAPEDDHSLAGALRRFRTVFDYVDAVSHGIDPPPLEGEEQAHEQAQEGEREFARPAAAQEPAPPQPTDAVQEPPAMPPDAIPPAPPISPAPPDWAPPR